MTKLWDLIKSTLIEKDGSNSTYGSIKRWAAWILLFLVFCVVMASIVPSFSLHIGTVFSWNFERITVDMNVLTALLSAIGTYVLGGQAITQITGTIQNYHNQKLNPNDTKGDSAGNAKAAN